MSGAGRPADDMGTEREGGKAGEGKKNGRLKEGKKGREKKRREMDESLLYHSSNHLTMQPSIDKVLTRHSYVH